MWVDKFTIRNLELFSSNGAREKCSFADVIDRTLTPMGGRLLKRWIAMPIKDPAKINERLDVVERLIKDADLADVIREQVSLVGDLERIAGRIAAQRVTPRELVQLKNSLGAIETLKAALLPIRRRWNFPIWIRAEIFRQFPNGAFMPSLYNLYTSVFTFNTIFLNDVA